MNKAANDAIEKIAGDPPTVARAQVAVSGKDTYAPVVVLSLKSGPYFTGVKAHLFSSWLDKVVRDHDKQGNAFTKTISQGSKRKPDEWGNPKDIRITLRDEPRVEVDGAHIRVQSHWQIQFKMAAPSPALSSAVEAVANHFFFEFVEG